MNELLEIRKAIDCLYLQLTASIVDDVKSKFEAYVASVTPEEHIYSYYGKCKKCGRNLDSKTCTFCYGEEVAEKTMKDIKNGP